MLERTGLPVNGGGAVPKEVDEDQLIDRLGRPYTPMMRPELRRGKPPANKGLKLPALVYPDSEVQRLLAAVGSRGVAGHDAYRARDTAAIHTLWRCGVRIAELLALEPGDVSLGDRVLHIRDGKGHRARKLGIPRDATASLGRWMKIHAALEVEQQGPLFVCLWRPAFGLQMQQPVFREWLKRLAKSAGLNRRVTPHNFRHTFAVNLMRAGAPLKVIQHALGHADARTTDIYLNYVWPEEVIKAMQRQPLSLRLGANDPDPFEGIDKDRVQAMLEALQKLVAA